MPKIETKVISLKTKTTRAQRTSVGTSKVNAHKAHRAREDRATHQFRYSGGLTRCSRCPPIDDVRLPVRFCDDCARINKARQHAGLIRPPGDHRPSPNNIINPAVAGKYRGPTIQRRYSEAPQPVVSAFVEALGKGWRRGVATLNGKRIYVGKPMQKVEDAWAYATNCQKLIRLGLEFESDCADVGVL